MQVITQLVFWWIQETVFPILPKKPTLGLKGTTLFLKIDVDYTYAS